MDKTAWKIINHPETAISSEGVREPLYIALEDLDSELEWTKREVRQMTKFIENGANFNHIRSVADFFERSTDETALLMIDRVYSDAISKLDGVGEIYHALEYVDVNYFWTMGKVKRFERMHKLGANIPIIAKSLNRKEIDVIVLTIDRGIKGHLDVMQS